MSPRPADARPSPRQGGDRKRLTNESAIPESFERRNRRPLLRKNVLSQRDHGLNSKGKTGNVPVPRAGALMTMEPGFPGVTVLKVTPPVGIGHETHPEAP